MGFASFGFGCGFLGLLAYAERKPPVIHVPIALKSTAALRHENR